MLILYKFTAQKFIISLVFFSDHVWTEMLVYPRHHTFLEGCDSRAISLVKLWIDFTESGKVRAGVKFGMANLI